MSLFVCLGELVGLCFTMNILVLFVGVSLSFEFLAYYYMLHCLVCMFVSHRQ